MERRLPYIGFTLLMWYFLYDNRNGSENINFIIIILLIAGVWCSLIGGFLYVPNVKQKVVEKQINDYKEKVSIEQTIKKAEDDYYKSLQEEAEITKKAIIKEKSIEFYKQGVNHYNTQNYYAAINSFDSAIEFEPNNEKYRHERGKTLIERGIELQSARNPYFKDISTERYQYYFHRDHWENNPDEVEYVNKYGFERFNLKDFHSALSDYNKAIQLNNRSPIYFNNRGICKYKIQDYLGAIEDFNSSIELDPTNGKYFNNRANAKFKLKQFLEALQDYEIATKLTPDNKDIEASRQLIQKYIDENILDKFSNSTHYYGAHKIFIV